jgi:Spy/CpxP family protein refolding chaperone
MLRALIISVVLAGLAAGGAVVAQSDDEQRSGQQRPSPHSAAVQNAGQPQGPPQRFKWWQTEQTKKELGLTNDQSSKIEEIWQAAVPRLQATFQDIDRYDQQLSKLLSANETTEMDVIRQLNLVQVAKNEADRQRTLMLFRMQRVLNFDQRMKLKAMRERWEQERGRGRSGEPPQRPGTPPKK